MSLSKNQLKLITSLQQKKYRQKHNLFIAEGVKVVKELVNSHLQLDHLFVTQDIDIQISNDYITYISDAELKKISSLKTPNRVLGLFRIPDNEELALQGLVVALDGVNDPGNLGTIIRLCDWFGVKQLLCSKNTVDCYNQKVIQSTMGSITRVQLYYVDLVDFLPTVKQTIYKADMDGVNVYKATLPKEAILVMGNEANGISDEVDAIIENRLTIPRFGDLQKAESLNVATATAILLSEFKR